MLHFSIMESTDHQEGEIMRFITCLFVMLIGLAAMADPIPCIEHSDYLKHVAELRMPPGTDCSFKDVVVKGRKAYAIGAYYHYDVLQIIDLLDDTAPALRGQLNVQPYTPCRTIAAIDHFVLMGGQNLLVIDVDDHDNPELVHVELSSTNVWDVVIHQRLAYVAQEAGGVQVYDLNLASAPVLLASVETPFDPRSLAITGDWLVVGGINGLAVYSLVEPGQPVFLGSTALSNRVLALDAEGTLAVAGGYETTDMVDLSDPTNPTVKATNFVWDVASCTLRDGIAWLGRNGSLDRWDVTDATAPFRVGEDFCRGYPSGLAFANGNVYTANWADSYQYVYEEGFHVYLGQEPASPPAVGLLGLTIDYNSHGQSDLLGDLLYVVGTSDIDVIDISDPAEPVLVGSQFIMGVYYYGWGGVVVGDHLLVRIWSLHPHYYYWDVYDLTDPLEPVFVETTDLNNPVTTHGDVVYEGSPLGVNVYTMTSAPHLEFLGTLWPGEYVGAPVFSNDRAAMFLENGEVRLVEFYGALEPEILGTVTAPPNSDIRYPLLYDGDMLVTKLWEGGAWEIWDVSDPGAPVLQFSEQPGQFDQISAVTLRDNFLYVSGDFKIQIWDVTDPGSPVHLGDRAHEKRENNTWLHQRPDYLLRTGYSGYIATMPYQCTSVSSVFENPTPRTPSAMTLRAIPNPFNPRTGLYFDLPAASAVTLTLYDLRGRKVKGLVSGWLGAGGHRITWDGCDDSGHNSAAGVYLARLEAGSLVATTRLVLIR